MHNTDHQAQQYDAIVIGSGIGGLAFASLLAQLKHKRVLVLERHYEPGGFTHTFKRRKGMRWDVGIHYIGGLGRNRPLRLLFDAISRGGIRWQQMPDEFEHYVFPDFTFSQKSNPKEFRADLVAMFPSEERAIDQYFIDLKKIEQWSTQVYYRRGLMPSIMLNASELFQQEGKKLAYMTVKQYLDMRFRDQRLRAIVAGQWGDHGEPPHRASMFVHSAIVNHYLWGGYYPVGTSKTIADHIMPIIREAGGDVLINHPVKRILVKNNTAIGVEVEVKKSDKVERKEFYAPVIVSNAGAWNTYCKLLGPEVKLPFRAEIEKLYTGSSSVTLYLGLKDSPAKLGMNGGNLWMYTGYDHDASASHQTQLLDGKVSGCYVSFPSLKDPEAEHHTAEVISFVPYQAFEKWKNMPWKKRGEEYEALKARIAESLISFVDAKYPGFRDLIEFQELSTPLSTEHFTGHYQGGIYGLPAIPQRMDKVWAKCKTPVKHLYMAGSDSASHGVAGALMGGVLALGHIYGASTVLDVFRLAKNYVKGGHNPD